MILKNLVAFYIFISLPLALLVLGVQYHYIAGGLFTILFVTYSLLYHPFISGLRLVQNNKISKQDFWKNFIPFWNDKYWTFLFFNK